MKKKILTILSVCTIGVTGFAIGNLQTPMVAFASENTVYVESSGSDAGTGTYNSPYATLDKALTAVENGGTITLKDTIALSSWNTHNKSVTITGGGLNASGCAEVEINDSVIFKNTAWVVDAGTYVYANGYQTKIDEGVTWSNEIRLFGGGKEGTTIAGTNLTVLSGTYTYIYGGSHRGTITGNTNLIVGGTVNSPSAVDTAIANHTKEIYQVYGGGHVDLVKGSTNVVFQDAAKAVYVYGGSFGWGSKINQGSNLKVTGGKIMGVYGGTNGADSGSSATTRIEGGSMQQVFGGTENFTLTGNVDLRIVGGTITRRIYGGCYGDGSKNYLVSGKINLELGGNVNIPLNANDSDKGIYARSRYKGDAEDCQIVFSSQMAYDTYKNKLGGNDWGASYVMGSTTAADSYHYYTYAQSDNAITQTCAYHTDHFATAEITYDESVSLVYTGQALTPIKVELDAAWEYDKPIISYANNVNIGKANYTVSIGQVCVDGQFIIVKTPTILGASIRLNAPSGLRFQSKIPAELVDAGATFGTLLIPKEELGNNELTVNTAEVNNVPQTKWATESLKEGNSIDYEEGYEFFNAVLTEIPEKHYDKVIVARSYVYANGQYYYSEPIERSVGGVSAQLLQNGSTYYALYDYVDKALADSTLSITPAVQVYDGKSYQLTLSGNKGYAAIWSTDSDLLTVDQNGKITAGDKEGTAIVRATIGRITVACVVTITYVWTGFY